MPESFNKTPIKNRFFGIRHSFTKCRTLTIYDCMQPAPRKGYFVQKKMVLKGFLRKVSYQMTPAYEGYLIKRLGL